MNAAMPPTVRGLIERQAAAQPEALYAVATESDRRVDYRELHGACGRVASLLLVHGCQPGETVSLVMPNGLGTLQLLLGALHGGWCVNPVNLLSQAEQMRYVLEHSDCTLILASGEWVDKVRALAPRAKVLAVDHDDLQLPAQASATAAPRPEATGLLMYTSGTTGRPKGVMLTQANLVANALSISAEHALTRADRVLGVLPLYHINGDLFGLGAHTNRIGEHCM